MQDLFKEFSTSDFFFASFVTLSFSFAYICNNFLLKSPQTPKTNNNFFLDDFNVNAHANDAFKKSIKFYYKKQGFKHRYDYPQSKLDNLDLCVLKPVKNISDFSNNWSILNMNSVINTINNPILFETSELAANSWPLYLFLKFLSNSDFFIEKLDSSIPIDKMILNLLNSLKLSGNFVNDPQVEFEKFLLFNKTILNNQTDDSINFLLFVLKNIYIKSLVY